MQKRIFGNVTFAFSAYIIDEVKQVTNNEKEKKKSDSCL